LWAVVERDFLHVLAIVARDDFEDHLHELVRVQPFVVLVELEVRVIVRERALHDALALPRRVGLRNRHGLGHFGLRGGCNLGLFRGGLGRSFDGSDRLRLFRDLACVRLVLLQPNNPITRFTV
jgi:hypothetical protein